MGGTQPTPESSGASPEDSRLPRRILACVLCQQRKVKCDRRFPCSQCTRSGSECVPAATLSARQRRPRFPERALLERLRKYEDLLRDHDVEFEPMHKVSNAAPARLSGDRKYTIKSGNKEDGTDRNVSGNAREVKDFWDAMVQGFQTSESPDDSPANAVEDISARRQWDGLFDNNDHLFFGLSKSSVSLPNLHPTPVDAFRLWQIYLDNVNPLYKVTHTPSLQPRVIEAVGNFTKLEPSLDALLFSIYCVALQTLTEDESMSIFKSPRGELLSRYRLGCQHALASCGYLRTTDRDCLTAHLLYLLSIGQAADPRALSATLGGTIRIAKRMGLHSEASLAKFPPFEIEMRRRLWWALALYDARIGEMVDYKNMGMSPTWDCKPPLNVNDSELWPDMKESPTVPIQSKPSEALFAVVRANIMNAVRYTSFYLDFTGFGLRGFDKKIELSDLETTIEDSFLRSCDPENPDHAMAVGMSRTAFARFRLMEHYSKQGGSSLNPSEAQRDAPIGFALSFLENDTKVIGSPRLKCYDWHQRLYFPLPGYIHLLYDLRMRPLGTNSARAWEAMGANYGARFRLLESADNPRFRSLANLVLVAWDARIAALSRGRGSNSSNSNSDKEAELAPLTPPRIVSDIRVARSSSLDNWGAEGGRAQEGRDTHLATAGGGLDDSSARRGNPELGMNNVPVGVFADSFQYGMDWQANFSAGLDVAGDTNVSQLNWSTLGWDLGGID